MSSTPPGKKQTKEDGPRSKLESEAPGTQHVGKVECMRSNRSIRLQSQSELGKGEGNTWVRDRKPSQDTCIWLRGVSWSEVNRTALRVQPGCPPRLTLAVVHIPCLVVTPPDGGLYSCTAGWVEVSETAFRTLATSRLTLAAGCGLHKLVLGGQVLNSFVYSQEWKEKKEGFLYSAR